MIDRRLFFVIVAICVVATVVVCTKSTPKGCSNLELQPKQEVRLLKLNELIDNEMSDLKQTQRFDRDIEKFMRRWEFTGVSFALMRNDSLIYAKGYGYADKERGEECDVKHRFRIASVSKLITATAIMKLVEEGRLSLGAQVFGENGIFSDSIYLDLRSRHHEKITVEHLLRHTSGFSESRGDPGFANYMVARVLDKELPLTIDDIVLYATKTNIISAPGGRYDYSNMGYMILGEIVERVSGVSYESYVRDSIMAPIGCYDIYIGKNYSRDRASNEVKYYEVKEAEPVEAYDGTGRMTMKSDGGNNVTLLGGAGGWVSSSVELLRFVASIDDKALYNTILTDETIRVMTDTRRNKHPIGWASVSKRDWLRSGSMAGTSALIKRQSDGYTWVFLVNNSAWIGPNITRYISSSISSAIAKVSDWPQRDMFQIATAEE
ncbi:MAG: serine hydrolase domain-containing protein [Rikenellaceae bacterium]